MKYRLGIDVGGTNTDAVLVAEDLNVIASVKVTTSKDIYSGIIGAIEKVLEKSGIDRKDISRAMLGTTQCTNAIVERKKLEKIAILRIGAPATVGIPPMVDWADDIRFIAYKTKIVGGGFEYDGKEIAPLDEKAIAEFFRSIKGEVSSVAISSAFSTVRADHEKRAAELAREILGEDVHLSLSSEIGSMGLVERENATILNASLYKVAESFTEGFEKSLRELGMTNAEVYISQNDGTLMTAEHARRYPILTISSGPTNSIRGASFLAGGEDAIVVDVGGTTTDVGSLVSGFPRESGVAVTIGGVRTNFRMPDVISIGLGGGSIVRVRPDGSVSVGPDSVGADLETKALVFGGDTITATDVAVKLGMFELGDASLLSGLDVETAEKALGVMREMVEDAIDAMKLSSDDVTVVLVGGGSVILPSTLRGAGKVLKPAHHAVANAIGSAISKVSGTFEKLVSYDEYPRDVALDMAKEEAKTMAVKAGARIDTVEIVDIEDVPLQYYPGNTVRIKIKAAGELA